MNAAIITKPDVAARLRSVGITPTRQRVEIGLHLFDGDKHLTADQLLEMVNVDSPEASKATIYNTLNLFASKGLVRELFVDPNKVVYDTNTTAHHHIYNVDSGELSDLPDGVVQIMGMPVVDPSLRIEAVDVVVRVSQRGSL